MPVTDYPNGPPLRSEQPEPPEQPPQPDRQPDRPEPQVVSSGPSYVLAELVPLVENLEHQGRAVTIVTLYYHGGERRGGPGWRAKLIIGDADGDPDYSLWFRWDETTGWRHTNTRGLDRPAEGAGQEDAAQPEGNGRTTPDG